MNITYNLNIVVSGEKVTLELKTPVNNLFDFCSMIQQQIKKGAIPINAEIHIIINPEENDCACVAYQLSEEKTQYNLLKVWDNTYSYPEVIKNEKALRDLIKQLSR